MSVTTQNDVSLGDTVKYYDYVSQSHRVGKVCPPPPCISEFQTNHTTCHIWCSFDDENVPEAIDVIKTNLIIVDSPTDSIEDKAPEITEQMTCSHPSDQVIINHVGMGTSITKFKYCKRCKADLGDV